MNRLLRTAISRLVIKNSLQIAIVVGTILNLINQGENILQGAQISWFHILLNYLVPYLVASYSAARNEIDSSPE